MKIITIKASTTNNEIEAAINFLDMRAHAIEMRDMAEQVMAEQGDQDVLELHVIGDVYVLYSPVFGYAYVNEQSTGIGNSLIIESGEADSPEDAAQKWSRHR